MTCIAAVVHESKVYMGGDSAGVSGYNITIRSDPKVFRNGEFLLGYTSSFRMGQILRYAFSPPMMYPDEELHKYMCTKFVNSAREAFKTGGFARKESEEEKAGVFLVGVRGHLYHVSSDYQVGESACGYDAVGCGDDFALGAFYATKGQSPRDRLNIALKAAENFSGGVRGPFVIEEI